MSPQRNAGAARREVPLLRDDEPVREAVTRIVEASVPALPVVDGAGGLRGIFGEREFIGALFPGYLTQLGFDTGGPQLIDHPGGDRPVRLAVRRRRHHEPQCLPGAFPTGLTSRVPGVGEQPARGGRIRSHLDIRSWSGGAVRRVVRGRGRGKHLGIRS